MLTKLRTCLRPGTVFVYIPVCAKTDSGEAGFCTLPPPLSLVPPDTLQTCGTTPLHRGQQEAQPRDGEKEPMGDRGVDRRPLTSWHRGGNLPAPGGGARPRRGPLLCGSAGGRPGRTDGPSPPRPSPVSTQRVG